MYARGGGTTGRNDRPRWIGAIRDISTGASSQTREMLDPPVEQWGAPTPRHPSRWLISGASYWRGRCQARSVSLVWGGIRPSGNRKVDGADPAPGHHRLKRFVRGTRRFARFRAPVIQRPPPELLAAFHSVSPSTRSQVLIAARISSSYTCVHVRVDRRVVAVGARGDEDGDARRCEERRAWGSIHCPSGPDLN